MDRKELGMILKEGEGYNIEFDENYFYVTFRQSAEYLKLAGREESWLRKALSPVLSSSQLRSTSVKRG